jgi:molybdate transport system substrate-binding protein
MRSYRATAVVLAGFLTLAACSGGSDSTSSGPASDGRTKTATPSATKEAKQTVHRTVTVFAASSLTGVFTDLGKQFEKAHPGTKVQFSFGASSDLAQQITQGAPADVFASASTDPMDEVTKDGDASGRPTVFVRNKLIIAVPKGNPAHVTTLADFAKPQLKIALCAKEVPCGSAAVTAFQLAGVKPKPDTYETDVKAALQKVILGEVDAALVYVTDVKAAGGKVEGVQFAESDGAINFYPIVGLEGGADAAGGKAFIDLVLSKSGRHRLYAAGFMHP